MMTEAEALNLIADGAVLLDRVEDAWVEDDRLVVMAEGSCIVLKLEKLT